MSDDASIMPEGFNDVPHGAVIVGVVPGIPPRVYIEAARYARVLSAPLAVVHVDVTRFVTFEDPDGYIHAAPVDVDLAPAHAQLAEITRAAEQILAGCGVQWSVTQLIGDPALAMKHLADRVDAKLLVVGTRKRGIGESIREFFTGSVAARLTHRQHRPVLVIPLGDPVPDDQPIDWGA